MPWVLNFSKNEIEFKPEIAKIYVKEKEIIASLLSGAGTYENVEVLTLDSPELAKNALLKIAAKMMSGGVFTP